MPQIFFHRKKSTKNLNVATFGQEGIHVRISASKVLQGNLTSSYAVEYMNWILKSKRHVVFWKKLQREFYLGKVDEKKMKHINSQAMVCYRLYCIVWFNQWHPGVQDYKKLIFKEKHFIAILWSKYVVFYKNWCEKITCLHFGEFLNDNAYFISSLI